jgi:hypothetical protein
VTKGKLRSAAGYLLVLHTLEELDEVEVGLTCRRVDDQQDTVALIRLAIAACETRLCKELLRFLHSIDESGAALRRAVNELDLPQRDLADGVDGIRIEAPSPTFEGTAQAVPGGTLSPQNGVSHDVDIAALSSAPGVPVEHVSNDMPPSRPEQAPRSVSLLAPSASTSSSSSSIPTIKRITVDPGNEGRVPNPLAIPDE